MMRLLITVVGAFLLVATAPAAAQCGCYGYGGNAAAWGGENALPVIGAGQVPFAIVQPYASYPQIEAYGYRNGYGYSDDEVYGIRPPIYRRYYRRAWRW